uniref:Uncharacterized protein n=1 Tax=Aegilops tauschii subsp. strangulata TaxID=200361 RepID=A0A453RNL8_AEGTS
SFYISRYEHSAGNKPTFLLHSTLCQQATGGTPPLPRRNHQAFHHTPIGEIQAQGLASPTMADFSSAHHHSLLKMPEVFTTNDTSTPNISSFLLYNQTSHGQSPAPANACAAMVEDASRESSSAVLDNASLQASASVDRKRKATDDSTTLSSAHSKVLTN